MKRETFHRRLGFALMLVGLFAACVQVYMAISWLRVGLDFAGSVFIVSAAYSTAITAQLFQDLSKRKAQR